MFRSAIFAVALTVSLWAPAAIAVEIDCIGLTWPVSGELIRAFAPNGPYAGHWGIDIAADHRSVVRTVAPGRVSFAGVVAGNLTVTVDHGGGLRTSYSYLDQRSVTAGKWVFAGEVVGRSGTPHDDPGLHFSVRIDGSYVNPLDWLGCHTFEPSRALRLVG